jgi:hypothetical protein
MRSTAWKRHERQTAQLLGGKRNCRGADFGQSIADVEHPVFSVEVKYRKKLPQLWREGLAQAKNYDRQRLLCW